jgi:hypothetical protein
VDEKSSQSCASLSACADCTKDRSLKCNILITVWHHNCRVVATKLKDGLSESSMDLS